MCTYRKNFRYKQSHSSKTPVNIQYKTNLERKIKDSIHLSWSQLSCSGTEIKEDNQTQPTVKEGQKGEHREKKACIKKRGIIRSFPKVLTADFHNAGPGFQQF